jgi:hypothetical protein
MRDSYSIFNPLLVSNSIETLYKKIGKIAASQVTEMSGNKITRMSAFQSGLINRNSRRGEFPQKYIFPTFFFVSFLHIALTLK